MRVRLRSGVDPEDQVPLSSGRHPGRQLSTWTCWATNELMSSHGRVRSCTPDVATVAVHHNLVKRVANTAATVLALLQAQRGTGVSWAQNSRAKKAFGVVSNPPSRVRVVRRSLALFPVVSWFGPHSKVLVGMARSFAGVLLSQYGAYQQSLPRRLMLQCWGDLKRQADVRLRRTYRERHPTRSALLGGIPWLLGLLHHGRCALPSSSCPYLGCKD